jgi:hypothetical protein
MVKRDVSWRRNSIRTTCVLAEISAAPPIITTDSLFVSGTAIGSSASASLSATLTNDPTVPASTFWDLDTFESAADDWLARSGVDPVLTTTSPFRGTQCLSLPSAWGTNFEGTSGLESGQTSAGYDTNTYPYMCMAYRMSSSVIANMLVRVGASQWYAVTMTQTETPVATNPKAASWNALMTDNVWRWRCLNLDRQMDAYLASTAARSVTGVAFGSGTTSPVVSGGMWIDDFVISAVAEPHVYFIREANAATWHSSLVWALVRNDDDMFAVSTGGILTVARAGLDNTVKNEYTVLVSATYGGQVSFRNVTVFITVPTASRGELTVHCCYHRC